MLEGPTLILNLTGRVDIIRKRSESIWEIGQSGNNGQMHFLWALACFQRPRRLFFLQTVKGFLALNNLKYATYLSIQTNNRKEFLPPNQSCALEKCSNLLSEFRNFSQVFKRGTRLNLSVISLKTIIMIN